MYICMWLYAYGYIYIHIYIHIYIYMCKKERGIKRCVPLYVYTCRHTYRYTHMCTYIYIYIHVYVYVYIHIRTYLFACIYIYIYTSISNSFELHWYIFQPKLRKHILTNTMLDNFEHSPINIFLSSTNHEHQFVCGCDNRNNISMTTHAY
jgi:hypothetical protein